MGKSKPYRMQSARSFLAKKRKYDKKKDPVWVYLESEMMQNIDKKPYNNKVGAWLKFLRDLRYYFFSEAQKKYKRLHRDAGPPWYCELSMTQRAVLYGLQSSIHKDILQKSVSRITTDLYKLGISIKFDKVTLKKCMMDSKEDTGLFLWFLYESYYKMSPAVLRLYYDLNAMIILSCFVFLDIEECLQLLKTFANALLPEKVPPPPPKKTPKYWEPDVKYGTYLQRMYVPLVRNKYLTSTTLRTGEFKIRLKEKNSYEKLREDLSFINLRLEERRKEQSHLDPRDCHYKFWKPPTRASLFDFTPEQLRTEKIMKLIDKFMSRPKKDHLKNHKMSLSSNEQFSIGTVVYAGDKPRYLINSVCIAQNGSIPIHMGLVKCGDEYFTCIQGFIVIQPVPEARCPPACDCMKKWDTVIQHLEESKCKCRHYYDNFSSNGDSKKASERQAFNEIYFHQPTKCGEGWFDTAKIYGDEEFEDDIKKKVLHALESVDSIEAEAPCFDAKLLKITQILEVFFGEIAHTSLIMPHLPNINYLNSLREWLRKRVHGKYSPEEHKELLLRAQRRWQELSHIDFKRPANFIPFTLEELDNFNWSHRPLLNKLFTTLLEDFKIRNSRKLVEQTRIYWPTMHYHVYPSKSFRDVFFTYMPGTIRDTFLIRPYDPMAPRRPLPIVRHPKES